jgi:hypothetical protein
VAKERGLAAVSLAEGVFLGISAIASYIVPSSQPRIQGMFLSKEV